MQSEVIKLFVCQRSLWVWQKYQVPLPHKKIIIKNTHTQRNHPINTADTGCFNFWSEQKTHCKNLHTVWLQTTKQFKFWKEGNVTFFPQVCILSPVLERQPFLISGQDIKSILKDLKMNIVIKFGFILPKHRGECWHKN